MTPATTSHKYYMYLRMVSSSFKLSASASLNPFRINSSHYPHYSISVMKWYVQLIRISNLPSNVYSVFQKQDPPDWSVTTEAVRSIHNWLESSKYISMLSFWNCNACIQTSIKVLRFSSGGSSTRLLSPSFRYCLLSQDMLHVYRKYAKYVSITKST